MNIDNDYDNEGNNIVPCPICLNVHCSSNYDGKCPKEDEFAEDMKTNKTVEELVREFTEEVEVEGCQAVHEGTKCTHCEKDPCPHCRQWGGKQRIEKRFRISEKQFIDTLTNLTQQVREEERERFGKERSGLLKEMEVLEEKAWMYDDLCK